MTVLAALLRVNPALISLILAQLHAPSGRGRLLECLTERSWQWCAEKALFRVIHTVPQSFRTSIGCNGGEVEVICRTSALLFAFDDVRQRQLFLLAQLGKLRSRTCTDFLSLPVTPTFSIWRQPPLKRRNWICKRQSGGVSTRININDKTIVLVYALY